MMNTARNHTFRSVHGVIPRRFLLIPNMNTRNNSLRRIYGCNVGGAYNLVIGSDHNVVCISGARGFTTTDQGTTRRIRTRVTRRLGGIVGSWHLVFREGVVGSPIFKFVGVPGKLLCSIMQRPLLRHLGHVGRLKLSSIMCPNTRRAQFRRSLKTFCLVDRTVRRLTAGKGFVFSDRTRTIRTTVLVRSVNRKPFSRMLRGAVIRNISRRSVSLVLVRHVGGRVGKRLALTVRVFGSRCPGHFLRRLMDKRLSVSHLSCLHHSDFCAKIARNGVNSTHVVGVLSMGSSRLMMRSGNVCSVRGFLATHHLVC